MIHRVELTHKFTLRDSQMKQSDELLLQLLEAFELLPAIRRTWGFSMRSRRPQLDVVIRGWSATS